MATRYITNWYCTTDGTEAQRLSELDHTTPDRIRVTENVEPLHVAESWIYWSDGRFTKAVGSKLPKGGLLASAAEKILSAVWGADGGAVEGGLGSLVDLAEIIGSETLETGPSRGHYARERIEQLHVRWEDGRESNIYVWTQGYFEGYQYDVYLTRESLDAAIKKYAPDER